MTGRALLIALSVVLVPLSPLGPGGGSTAASAKGSFSASAAPWWGPGDPADAAVGWHVRVPVVVSNPYDFPLTDALVQVELDIGRLLIDAGWNGRTLGATAFPTSFTLDADSVRAIRYTAGFVDVQDQTPTQAAFYPGRLSVGAEAPYSASRNPAGTFVFIVDGSLPPRDERAYMLYFTSEQQGGREADDAASQLGAWASRSAGRTIYGFEQGAQGRANRIDILASQPTTTVSVYTYKGGRPTLAELPSHPNPLVLNTQTDPPIATVSLPAQSFFKVTADRPVVVGGRGLVQTGADTTYGGGAFVPALSGHFVGTRFLVPAYAPEAYLATSGLGTARVTVSALDGSSVQAIELSTARPTATLPLPVTGEVASLDARRLDVSGVPITVQLAGALVGRHTAVSREGAVGGLDHFVAAPPGTLVNLHPRTNASVRVLDAARPLDQLFPFGAADVTPSALVAPYPPTRSIAANDSWPATDPVRVVSTAERDLATAARLLVTAGQGSAAGPFLVDDRLSTITRGPLAVMGAYNGTRVTFNELLPGGQLKATAETVHRDGVVLFRPDDANVNGEAAVTLTKPATLVPTVERERYARVFPAYDLEPAVRVGELDFRGALVRLAIEGSVGGQAVRTLGPGQSTRFELTVSNVGHWTDGAPITDEVEIVCDEAPVG